MPEPDEIGDGLHAQRLLDDDVLQRAFEEAEVNYISKWMNAGNPVVREEMWHRMKALKDVQGNLRTTIERGDFAQAKAEQSR